jgi:hypothetical protein
MNDWLENVAQALGEPALTPEETGVLLRLARDVAHGVERKLAPLSAFLVGAAVGRRSARGESRDQALRQAVEAALGLIPPAEESVGS